MLWTIAWVVVPVLVVALSGGLGLLVESCTRTRLSWPVLIPLGMSALIVVTTFVTAIGGISMVVAGVSIFNIMMMSVNERIKEIGIMRSIGAQKKEVMSMFIYEAAIIGVIGSVVGGLFSIIAGYAISALMLGTTKYLFTVANALSVTEGVVFGIVVCLVCGIYPARTAANMNPIDALRHE